MCDYINVQKIKNLAIRIAQYDISAHIDALPNSVQVKHLGKHDFLYTIPINLANVSNS